MFRGFQVLGDKLRAFSPILRSYSINLAKIDAEKAKNVLQKFKPVVSIVRNSSHGDKTMVVRVSKFVDEKYYDEIVSSYFCYFYQLALLLYAWPYSMLPHCIYC